MAPLINAVKQDNHFTVQVCVTAQHREILNQDFRRHFILDKTAM
jgi:UDP-N-acetylglucosamine 2-epimerase